MLQECMTLLLDVFVQTNVSDRWVWLPDPSGGYSVRGVYSMLTTPDVSHVASTVELVWHRQFPLKVSVFVWRLLRDRLPTKSNLVSKGVITSVDCLCVSGCGYVETAQHRFLSCTTFAFLWSLVQNWIGFLGVDSNIISDHFIRFIHATGGGKARCSFLQLI